MSNRATHNVCCVFEGIPQGLLASYQEQYGDSEAVVTPGILARNEGSRPVSGRDIEREDGEHDLSVRIVTMSQDEPEPSL